MTDIECLLSADVGILMRDEPISNGQKQLAELLQNDAKTTASVDDQIHDLDFKTGNKLFWAYDLKQVETWISKYRHAFT